MRSLAVQRINDVRGAVTTLPDARTWLTCAAIFAVFLGCAAPIGFLSGFLHPTTPPLAANDLIATALAVFVQPALVEEIIFRGVLVPRDFRSTSRRVVVGFGLGALALYVISHPINAALFRPAAMSVFARPVYLLLATLLGIVCTAAYWISKSIWPPVLIHWVTVLAWLWFFGGQRMLA